MARGFKAALCDSAMPDQFPGWWHYCKRRKKHLGKCRAKFTDAYRTWSDGDIYSKVESFAAIRASEKGGEQA